jgi:hypothetical protein
MAKYIIEYTCGHEGHREVQLFGPHKERERKLEWMAQECLCPECWKAKKEAEQKALGIVARVRACPGTKPAILIELHGDTYQIKDAAKERGYSFGALHAGSNIIFAVLGSEKESKGWMLSIDVRGNLEDAAQKLAAEIEWIKSIPNLNAEKSSWLSPADMEYLRVGLRRQQEKSDAEAAAAAEAAAKKAAADAWLAENPRPQVRGLRQIVGAPRNARWNRKWYGRDERRVYLDGTEYILTKEQKAEYEASVAAVAAWREKAKAAGVTL